MVIKFYLVMPSLIHLNVPRMYHFAFSNNKKLARTNPSAVHFILAPAMPVYSDNFNYVTLV